MSLPYIQSDNNTLQLLQTQYRSQLNPVLANPLTNPLILKNVLLANGITVINHKLQRMMQGFIISDIDSPATIYRSAPLNDLTLTLTSNATATVAIVVF
jgi:hypothetical protein